MRSKMSKEFWLMRNSKAFRFLSRAYYLLKHLDNIVDMALGINPTWNS